MADMLVNLLKLPAIQPVPGIVIRRALPFEMAPVRQFIASNFGTAWADEASVAYSQKPPTLFIATNNGSVCGFCAYECTARAFLGPEGVDVTHRRRGIGKALLLFALNGLRELGYVYGIVGGIGPEAFYTKAVGATMIPESTPGIYVDHLK